MKKILFLLLFPVFASAQSKGDKKITVTPADTAKLFDKIITLLYTEGYVVKVEDKARGFIATEYKALKSTGAADMFMKFLLQDGKVVMTGQAKSNISISLGGTKMEQITWEVEYRNAKGNTLRQAFDEMDKFAKLIGDKIVYSK